MRTTKTIALVLAAIMLAAALSACSVNNPNYTVLKVGDMNIGVNAYYNNYNYLAQVYSMYGLYNVSTPEAFKRMQDQVFNNLINNALPVVVAKQNGVRPSQPLTSAVVASQIAISASPISAATAAMWVVVETMGVSFGQVLCVILPAGLFGAAVASLISAFQGVDLEKDPIFQARMKAGLVAMSSQEQRDAPLPKGAKLSVVIFLLSVVFIVAMLLFKKEIGHTLGSRDIIVITMLFISMLMYWFCDVELTKIKNSSIFKGGYESLVVILGICWLASTVIGIYIPTIKEQATVLLGQYPGLLALAFFCVSALLFSQGATSALLVPVAASLGCDAPMILACFVAVSGIFVTNVYPTSAFAISCDDTGSFMGKWSGTYVINHPFFLPGCLGLVAAIPFGFLMAGLVF